MAVDQSGVLKLFSDVGELKCKLNGDIKNINTAEALNGKTVGLYFSAHWCPPCRGFTPKLAKVYEEVKKKHPEFEIVFISSDKNQEAFDEYFNEMPWMALPYNLREKKAKLSKKFGVEGIPMLVILDKEGNVLNKNARGSLSKAGAEGFPWAAPKFRKEDLCETFVNNKGEKITFESLAGKDVAIYFSAHWCPPCRGFTPKLAERYNKLKARNVNCEFIFVSGDRTQADFDGYLKEMPWYAVDYKDEKTRDVLDEMFPHRGIPFLVTIEGATGKIINDSARGMAEADEDAEEFPWRIPVPCELNQDMGKLNDIPSLVIMCEFDTKENQAMYKKAITKRAKAEAALEDEQKYYLAWCEKDGSIPPQVRKYAKSEGKDTIGVIVDISNKTFYRIDAPKNEAEVDQVFVDFENGKFTKIPM